MTFEQLQEKYPTATLETWHRHNNGGGWVENTAYVDIHAIVSDNSIVRDSAIAYGYERLSE